MAIALNTCKRWCRQYESPWTLQNNSIRLRSLLLKFLKQPLPAIIHFSCGRTRNPVETTFQTRAYSNYWRAAAESFCCDHDICGKAMTQALRPPHFHAVHTVLTELFVLLSSNFMVLQKFEKTVGFVNSKIFLKTSRVAQSGERQHKYCSSN